MVVGILTAIGLVFHGITTVIGKAWDITKDILDWFFRILPGPIKFFFFLYMALFLVSIIMPTFLGASFSCDSVGTPYKINFVKLKAMEQYVDHLASLCGFEEETEQPITEMPSFSDLIKNFFIKIWEGVTEILTPPGWWKVYNAYAVGDVNATQAEICDDWRTAIQSNQIPERDFVLREWGESVMQSDYKQVIHVGCSRDNEGEWYQTLKFFSLDIFNFEMWLLLGVIGIITPFVFKWYNWVHKR